MERFEKGRVKSSALILLCLATLGCERVGTPDDSSNVTIAEIPTVISKNDRVNTPPEDSSDEPTVHEDTIPDGKEDGHVESPTKDEEKKQPIVYVEGLAKIHDAVLGGTVTLVRDGTPIYRTETDTETGRWKIPKESFDDRSRLTIVIEGGESAGKAMTGSLCLRLEDTTLDKDPLLVDPLSTVECRYDQNVRLMRKHDVVTESSQRSRLNRYLAQTGIDDVFFGTESLETWADSDWDGDGLGNWMEISSGLNPTRKDTDRDGIGDGDEREIYRTDPLNPDSDGDYLPDGAELRSGSDPLDADEDADGVVDGLEGDPLFGYQWYIHNPESRAICTTSEVKTVAGNDLNLMPVYHRTLGNSHGSMVVQVVDGGVDAGHEDLQIDMNRSINSVNGSHDPTPVEGISWDPIQIFMRGHGTAVAGIIGAKGNNGLGIRGVAPQVRIAGNNWLESQKIETLEKVWYTGEGANDIVVSNNSWGGRFIDDESFETLMRSAVEDLREGKGRIFVFAAGNDRQHYGNSNLSYLTNNPYVVAVAALNHEDRYASYSSPGSNILVSAYGGERYYEAPTIMTTFSPGLSMYADELAGRKGPITVDEDESKSYTYAMNGTSAAAPMVSGVLALVLDQCPELTWRDVKWLIAHTAIRVDANASTWIRNGAGMWHSNDYGFGKINALGMIRQCTSDEYTLLPRERMTVVSKKEDLAIPDDNTTVETTIPVENDLTIEWVGVTIATDHPFVGDLAIDVVSPAGTVSHLIGENTLRGALYKNGFRFSTVSLMGEKSSGTWKIRLRDEEAEDSGRLTSVKLDIRGH